MFNIEGFLVAMFLVPVACALNGRLSRKVAQLERKVNAVLLHSGINPESILELEIRALLQQNQLTEAIRVYQEDARVSAATAKRYVESLLIASVQVPPTV